MKKTLIPIATLLAFSMLITSVSAPVPEYFAAHFQGHANGMCWIFTEYPGPDVMPEYRGRGRVCIRGLAIVREDTGYYWANETDPNTRIQTRRTSMKASWENDLLVVYMWSSDPWWGRFYDEEDWFMISMEFSGYYKEFPGAPPQYIRGGAFVEFVEYTPPEGPTMLMAFVMLYRGEEHWLSFMWTGEYEGMPSEYLARSFSHRVTVWPIGRLLSIR